MKTVHRKLLSVLLVLFLITALMPCSVLAADGDVCEIVGGTSYPTLDGALTAVQDGDTIQLLEDIDYDGGIVIEDKSVTFDLNGYTLNVVNSAVAGTVKEKSGLYVKGDAVVSLIDASGEGEFNVTGWYGVYAASTEDDTDSVTNNNTTVTVTSASGIEAGVTAYNSKVTVKGNVTSNDGGYGIIANYQYSEVTVDGDVIAGGDGGTGVLANSLAKVTVKGNVSVNGVDSIGVRLFDDGDVTVEKDVTATGSGSIGIQSAGSCVTVLGNVTGDLCGVDANYSSSIDVAGDVLSFDASGYGIKASENCDIDVGGDVRSNGTGVNIWAEGPAAFSEITIDGVIEADEYILIGITSFDISDGVSDPDMVAGYRIYTDAPVDPLGAVLVAEFAGGSGTQEDPFLIAHADQLYNVRDHLNKHFKQTANLDLSGFGSGSGWVPIGTSTAPFAGTYDGNGHSISDLFIDQVGVWNVRTPAGLFGYTGSEAEICNLTLEDVDVTGCYYVGSLVGNNSGEISNVSSSGIVIGEWDTGGLVGRNSGLITGSAFTGAVTGTDEIEYCEWTGGLVGYNFGGTITKCQTNVTVVSEGNSVGGLVGESLNDGIITESCATGSVRAYSYTGGLVGSNDGEITACYSTCTVDGSNDVGGLAGGNSGPITDSYAVGLVDGANRVGGLVGSNTGATVTDCYWDIVTSGQNTSACGTGKTTADMKQQATFVGWDFLATWNINAVDNNGYPFLRWQSVVPPEFAGGDGSVDNPFLVANADQLNNVRNHLDKHFMQTHDINLSGYSTGEGWEPIGDNSNPFTGTYDGNEFSINNLFIDRNDYYSGLFGYIAVNGNVSDLELNSVDVTSNSYWVGGLVGRNNGLIDNCSVTGTVMIDGWYYPIGGLVGENHGIITNCSFDGTVESDDDFTGGLVGWDEGTITNCHTTGTVRGDDEVGGLVGYKVSGVIQDSHSECAVESVNDDSTQTGGLVGNNDGEINGCYALGAVTGNEDVGGLVGFNFKPGGVIVNCYAAGSVTGNDYVGGLAGGNAYTITYCYSTGAVTAAASSTNAGGLLGYTSAANGIVTDSYWNTETSAQSTSAGGEGKTTDYMKQQATFENWDFTTVWGINAGKNNGFPYLRWQYVIPTYALTITAGTGGTITVGASGNYEADTVINIAATPSSGYSFDRWTSVGGGTFGSTTAAATTFTMPANAVAITAGFTYDGSGGGGGGGGSSNRSAPSFNAEVLGTGRSNITLPVNVNTETGNATTDLGNLAENILSGNRTAVINVPSIPDVDTFTLNIPVPSLSGTQEEGTLSFNTDAGSITLPDNMLSGIAEAEGKEVAGITIGYGDKSGLPDEVKAAVGDRPILQLTMTLDGEQTDWNNPDVPVTVSVPYTPTAAELADPEHIVVWYIDGAGNAVSVPNGRYDPETGTVTFTTTHFSYYAIAYVQKTFSDLGSVIWAKESIEVLASKGILQGTSFAEYSPDENITRADFLCFLVRALSVDAVAGTNFDDISNDAYYYKEIAIAKKLGITSGTGNNKFSPDAYIARQDMMALTERALRMLKKLDTQGTPSDLDRFSDKSMIADYAVNSVASVVKEGLIVGSDGKVYPLNNTTRAEAAVFLYKIYNKYI